MSIKTIENESTDSDLLDQLVQHMAKVAPKASDGDDVIDTIATRESMIEESANKHEVVAAMIPLVGENVEDYQARVHWYINSLCMNQSEALTDETADQILDALQHNFMTQ